MESTSKLWKPLRCSDTSNNDSIPFSVIVLNLPIQNYKVFSDVIDKGEATLVIAADGGANRMKDYYESEHGRKRSVRVPDAIVGDLDSLLPETRRFFEAKGVPIKKDPDQYSTDFTKCLKHISDVRLRGDSSLMQIDTVVFGGLGGRADQAFAQLHQLYLTSLDDTLHCGDIYLYSEESVMFLLENGKNEIWTPVGPEKLGENVGIVPLAGPAIITTTGLEWDVENWHTSFGTQVSTSNHIRSEYVTVESNERVLFTVELDRKPIANG